MGLAILLSAKSYCRLSPPAWTSFAGMLSTPADFPFFSDCTGSPGRPGQQGQCLLPYTRTEVSSMLLVHHRRFEEETTSR